MPNILQQTATLTGKDVLVLKRRAKIMLLALLPSVVAVIILMGVEKAVKFGKSTAPWNSSWDTENPDAYPVNGFPKCLVLKDWNSVDKFPVCNVPGSSKGRCVSLMYTPTNSQADQVAKRIAQDSGMELGSDIVGMKTKREAFDALYDNMGCIGIILNIPIDPQTSLIEVPVAYELWFNSTVYSNYYPQKGKNPLTKDIGVSAEFLQVQLSVEKALASVITQQNVEVDISVQPWPVAGVTEQWTGDFDQSAEQVSLRHWEQTNLESLATGSLLVVAQCCLALAAMTLVVNEKSTKILALLRSVGINEASFWMGKLISFLPFVVLGALISEGVGRLLQVQFFAQSDAFIPSLTLSMSGAAFISCGLALSAIVTQAKWSVLAGFLFMSQAIIKEVIIPLVAPMDMDGFLSMYSPVQSIGVKLLLNLFPGFHLGKVVAQAVNAIHPAPNTTQPIPSDFASQLHRFTWHDFNTADGPFFTTKSFEPWYAPSAASTMLYMLALTVGYLILAIYLAQVASGDLGGGRRSFMFPLQPSYWNGSQFNPDSMNLHSQDTIAQTQAKSFRSRSIVLHKISKAFEQVNAVREVSLVMERGSVFCLLGANGAGKSTLVSMIAGLAPPTHGHGFVAGMSIQEHSDQIRRNVGICPQDNILWPFLTAQEHVRLFSKLRGADDTQLAIDTILDKVGLKDVPSVQLVSGFSGGMKRRLSLALSLVGQPSVVLLDEPTTGQDPVHRRQCWEAIRNLKKHAVVLLTTHHMQEADELGDRIAVMHDGRLRALGSSEFLKRKFGSGFTISIQSSGEASRAEIDQLVSAHSTAQVISNVAGRYLVGFSHDQSEDASRFMESLQQISSVREWSFSPSTMEEVYLKLIPKQDISTDDDFEEDIAFQDGEADKLSSSLVQGEGSEHDVVIEAGTEAIVEADTIDNNLIQRLSPVQYGWKAFAEQVFGVLDMRAMHQARQKRINIFICLLVFVSLLLCVILTLLFRAQAQQPEQLGPYNGQCPDRGYYFYQRIMMGEDVCTRTGYVDYVAFNQTPFSQPVSVYNDRPYVGQYYSGTSFYGPQGSESSPAQIMFWYNNHTADGKYIAFDLLRPEYVYSVHTDASMTADEARHLVLSSQQQTESSYINPWENQHNCLQTAQTFLSSQGSSARIGNGSWIGKLDPLTASNKFTSKYPDYAIFFEEYDLNQAKFRATINLFPPRLQYQYMPEYFGDTSTFQDDCTLIRKYRISSPWDVTSPASNVAAVLSQLSLTILQQAAGPDAYFMPKVYRMLDPTYYNYYNVDVGIITQQFVVPVLLMIVLPLITASLTREKSGGNRGLLLQSGLHPAAYWTAQYLWSTFLQLVLSLVIFILCAALGTTSASGSDNKGTFWLMCFCWSHAQTGMAVFLSGLFQSDKPATILAFAFNLLSVVLVFTVQIISSYETWPSVIALIPPIGLVLEFIQLTENAQHGYLNALAGYMFLGGTCLLFAGLMLHALYVGSFGRSPKFGCFPSPPKIDSHDGEAMARISIAEKDVQKEVMAAESMVHEKTSNGVVLSHVYKSFGQASTREFAVKDLSLAVETGTVTALLGENGAGKTTALSIICGTLDSTSGTAQVFGLRPDSNDLQLRNSLGYVPQQDIIWEDLTVEEHLRLFQRTRNSCQKFKNPMSFEASVRHIAEIVRLDGDSFRMPAGKLSGGQRRRLSIGIAICGNPRVLVYDEISTGLDPEARQVVWKVVEYLKKDRVVLLTTHLLDEAEALSDRVAIMTTGTLRCIGTPLQLRSRFGTGSRVSATLKLDADTDSSLAAMIALFSGSECIRKDVRRWVVNVPDSISVPSILTIMEQNKDYLSVKEWSCTQASLEDVFVSVVEEGLGSVNS